jgi:hypothetical protein
MTQNKMFRFLLSALAIVSCLSVATLPAEAKDKPKAKAQATAEKVTPKPATGTVIVYNKTLGPLPMPFKVNGGPRINVPGGRYYRLQLPAGEHVLSGPVPVLLSLGPLNDDVRVKVKAGETIYFSNYAVPFMGPVFEVAEDQADAARKVSRLKPMN